MSRYMNSRYADLKPYVPGEQPKDRILIKLNTNESPFAPSPAVMDVINRENAALLRLYEDPKNEDLNLAIAGSVHVYPEMVMATGGSDEALDLAFMAFGEDGAAFADETYGFYRVLADLHHIDTEIIPLKEDYSIDPGDYEHLGRMAVIANPGAPTGLLLSRKEIEGILKSNPDHVVIVDEAYVDFGNESMIPLTSVYDNLLVVQTFSKSRNLAGARIGFACGNAQLIQDLNTLRNSRNPYNVTRLSQLAGIAAIRSAGYYRKCCDQIVHTRDWTERAMRDLGFTVLDSHANFVFAAHPSVSGQEVQRRLREKGILVRHFDHERIRDFNRITIGTEQDMQQLMEALREIVK